MGQNGEEQDKVWLNNKFREGYGKYLLNGKYCISYSFEIGTFGFKDRFKIWTRSDKFIHADRSGSRSWHDDLEFLGELEDIRKLSNF